MSLNFYCEEEDANNKEVSINKYKYLFSSYVKDTPSLSEALYQMYKSSNLDDETIKKLTNELLSSCKGKIDPQFDSIKSLYNKITKEDAYIICSYTYESTTKEYSPYRLLNTNLTNDDRKNGVRNISKYLYILLKALRKLPRYYPKDKYLYRSINHQINISTENTKNSSYIKGNQKTFWPFTSTSPDPKTAYAFLNKDDKIKTGTVFTLGGDIWGYDIKLFNCYDESEILVEPERKYIIENVLPPLNGIINITCTILESNLVLSGNEFEQSKTSNIFDKSSGNDREDNLNTLNEHIIKFEMEAKINEESKYTSGIGVLCNIPSKKIKALITYNHLINMDFLNNGEKMILYINKKEHEINIKINRYKYTNEDLDITIIEILDEDNITNYIEIDKFINSKNYTDYEIISISLLKEKDLDFLEGKITKKDDDTSNYICNIEKISEGIIILKENMKLLGIIKESKNQNEINIIPMNIIMNKINFIKCIYNIKVEDTERDIQIINNKGYDDKNKNEEIEKEIKVIINGEIKSNILKYKFTKEGEYTIYLSANKNLTNMAFMFNGCSSLEELYLSTFNTNHVNNMQGTFGQCSLLKELDLSSFNTNQVTNMSGMFENCSSLKELNLLSFNTEQVTNMAWMFNSCSSLEKLNLTSFNTSQVTNMSGMFNECSSLKEMNLSSFNTNQVKYMSDMFSFCSSLKKLNLSSFNTNQVINMSTMFYKCSSLKELILSSSFKTNQVTNMYSMFNNCSSLEEINLSSFYTNQVTNMSDMFSGCSSLKELNLSSFNTDKVTDMSNMFGNCSSLEVINFSSFNNYQVSNMSKMFDGCSSLTKINFSSFNTNQVTDMSDMFNNCSSLTELNLSSFDTNQVTNMSTMFCGCTSLKSLNLSSFKTTQVKYMSYIFDSINKSCKLKCKDKQILKEFKKAKGCIIF